MFVIFQVRAFIGMSMGLITLNSLAAFSIKGALAKKFLQGQLTCDLEQLKSNEALHAAHCNKEGRVVALYTLFQHDDEIILITARELLAEAMAKLKHYGMFSKLEWRDLSADYHIVGCIGALPAQPAFAFGAVLPGSVERHLLLRQGVAPINADESLWFYQCLLLKEAFLTAATLGKFLPQELGLQGAALSFTKGCYLGQEVIARVHYRGKLKRELRLLSDAQYLEPLAEIFSAGKVVGEVVASIQYQGRCHLLALVDKTYDDCSQRMGVGA